MAKFYAVRVGRVPGIYQSWEDCKKQTEGYPSPQFKSFKTAEEAAEFMGWSKNKGQEDSQANNQLTGADKKTETELTAYVDGSYNTATGEYGYGAVIITADGEVELYEKGTDQELAQMRNVAGEIKASEAAMRYAMENGYKSITIFHDYEGIARWCTGDWKTNKEGTKEYKNFFDEVSKKIEVSFVKVKGHSGDKYNDKADMLAKRAAGLEQ